MKNLGRAPAGRIVVRQVPASKSRMRWKWPDREWLLVTNKGDKGEKLPKVLDKTEAEALELFIEVPGHGDHDKLGNSQQKDEMNDKPGDDPIGESVEHPHE